jgi:hypothetical protein
MARREAAAAHPAGPPVVAASAAAPALPRPMAGEPVAPAVVGGSVNRCIVNGQLIYTNSACPEGSRAAPVSAVDEAAAPAGSADPGQQQVTRCNYLAAETARLDYEFSQPLPPPVLDHISTRLADLRARAEDARCVTPPKAAASAPARRSRQ